MKRLGCKPLIALLGAAGLAVPEQPHGMVQRYSDCLCINIWHVIDPWTPGFSCGACDCMRPPVYPAMPLFSYVPCIFSS